MNAVTRGIINRMLKHLIAILALSKGFIPTMEQVRMMTELVLGPLGVFFKGLSPKTWLIVITYAQEHFQLLYPKSMRGRRQVYHDGKLRGEEVVINMLKLGLKKLVLIDGHGRLLFHVFTALSRRGLNLDDYTVYVVDISPIATSWHELFFPRNVVSVYSDICDYEFPENSYFYGNFCSVNRALVARLRNLPVILKGDFMISFTERQATQELLDFRSWFARYTGVNRVIRRNQFYTFTVNKIT